MPLYLTDIYEHPTDSHRLHVRYVCLSFFSLPHVMYMFTAVCEIECVSACMYVFLHVQYMFIALRDCVPTIKWSRHQESPAVLLEMFDKEVSSKYTH